MDQNSYVHDCTSNLIFLDQYVSGYNKNLIKLSNEQYRQSAEAVSASALLFEFQRSLTRYYYRPFDLHRSLLVGATFSNGIWKVNNYFENPSAPFLLSLFKRYLLKGSVTLYLQNEIAEDYFGIKQVIQLGNTVIV